MKKLLFLCGKNKLRSPTAEEIFSKWEDLEVLSAGVSNDAQVLVDSEMILWADIIFVMEKVHKSKLSKKFQKFLKGKKVICLDIPDEYEYMSPELVEILERKVLPLLKLH